MGKVSDVKHWITSVRAIGKKSTFLHKSKYIDGRQDKMNINHQLISIWCHAKLSKHNDYRVTIVY